jgi:hypothetical protein
MICPKCQSSDLKKVSLVHAAGLYESRGRIRGFLLGESDGLLLGSYRGKNQSRLSKMVRPPAKFPYAAPVILWLLGFFLLMAFVGRESFRSRWVSSQSLTSCCYPPYLFQHSSTTRSGIPVSTRTGKARSCASAVERSSTLTAAHNQPDKLKHQSPANLWQPDRKTTKPSAPRHKGPVSGVT